MKRARILGTGSCVPDRVVTNQDLTQFMDTSDEWIVERTGIRERRWVEKGSGVGSSDLGAEAARRALSDAGVAASDLDLVVFATISPDHDFPGNGPILQRKLGIRATTLDVRQQCTGFLYGVSIADAYIRAGMAQHVLVVAGEVQSTGLDLSNRGRDMSVLFADGGGAAVIGPASDGERMILSSQLYTDGDHVEDLWCEFPSSKEHPRLSPEAVAEGRHLPRMNGRVVFKHAAQRVADAVQKELAKNGVTIDDVALMVPHQANLRILEKIGETLGLPSEKMMVNLDRYGNTTAASIPLALDEARRAGRVKAGDLVCLAAFGAGFAWGAALLRL
jgi:3-oxoacyl-[acyl-carrier-protein] synthase III